MEIRIIRIKFQNYLLFQAERLVKTGFGNSRVLSRQKKPLRTSLGLKRFFFVYNSILAFQRVLEAFTKGLKTHGQPVTDHDDVFYIGVRRAFSKKISRVHVA
jgi:hypothetical protein